MRWLAAAMIGATFVAACPPIHAQGYTVLAGCGSKQPAQRSAKDWRKLIEKAPTRDNWRAAMTDWGDANGLSPYQCLSIRRLQAVSGSYKLDVVSVPIPYTRESALRPPDWEGHAEAALHNGLPAEGIEVIRNARIRGYPDSLRSSAATLMSEFNRQRLQERNYPLVLPDDPATAAWVPARLHGEGTRALSEGKYEHALAFFRREAAAKGFDARNSLDSGYAHVRLNQPKEATAAFKRAAAKAPPIEAEIARFWLLYLEKGAR